MGIEAFVWVYQNGEPASLPFSDVAGAFGDAVREWDPESGRLRLVYGSEIDSCDVYCCKGEGVKQTGRVTSLLIARPIGNPEFWEAVLKIMSLGHALLFFSDDTAPRFRDIASASHFPKDLIASLGTPLRTRTAKDIIESRER